MVFKNQSAKCRKFTYSISAIIQTNALIFANITAKIPKKNVIELMSKLAYLKLKQFSKISTRDANQKSVSDWPICRF